MRFDDLDKRLRQYETAYDFCVPQENFIVVRLDGRGFTRLTKEIWQFEAPFDIRFRDLMAHTVHHLIRSNAKRAKSFRYWRAKPVPPFPWRTGSPPLLMRGFAFCRTKGWWSIISAGGMKTHTATRSAPTAIGCCAKKAKAYPTPPAWPAGWRAVKNTICCLKTASISTNCPHGRNAASACIFRRP